MNGVQDRFDYNGVSPATNRDLQLAAQLGQSLLEKNKDLAEQNEALEDQVVTANSMIEQLQSELRRKTELLRMCLDGMADDENQRFGADRLSNAPAGLQRTESMLSLSRTIMGNEQQISCFDRLKEKLEALEQENRRLKQEQAVAGGEGGEGSGVSRSLSQNSVGSGAFSDVSSSASTRQRLFREHRSQRFEAHNPSAQWPAATQLAADHHTELVDSSASLKQSQLIADCYRELVEAKRFIGGLASQLQSATSSDCAAAASGHLPGDLHRQVGELQTRIAGLTALNDQQQNELVASRRWQQELCGEVSRLRQDYSDVFQLLSEADTCGGATRAAAIRRPPLEKGQSLARELEDSLCTEYRPATLDPVATSDVYTDNIPMSKFLKSVLEREHLKPERADNPSSSCRSTPNTSQTSGYGASEPDSTKTGADARQWSGVDRSYPAASARSDWRGAVRPSSLMYRPDSPPESSIFPLGDVGDNPGDNGERAAAGSGALSVSSASTPRGLGPSRPPASRTDADSTVSDLRESALKMARIRYVKPVHGSTTLHQWQHLAIDSGFDALLAETSGVSTRAVSSAWTPTVTGSDQAATASPRLSGLPPTLGQVSGQAGTANPRSIMKSARRPRRRRRSSLPDVSFDTAALQPADAGRPPVSASASGLISKLSDYLWTYFGTADLVPPAPAARPASSSSDDDRCSTPLTPPSTPLFSRRGLCDFTDDSDATSITIDDDNRRRPFDDTDSMNTSIVEDYDNTSDRSDNDANTLELVDNWSDSDESTKMRLRTPPPSPTVHRTAGGAASGSGGEAKGGALHRLGQILSSASMFILQTQPATTHLLPPRREPRVGVRLSATRHFQYALRSRLRPLAANEQRPNANTARPFARSASVGPRQRRCKTVNGEDRRARHDNERDARRSAAAPSVSILETVRRNNLNAQTFSSQLELERVVSCDAQMLGSGLRKGSKSFNCAVGEWNV